MAAKADRERMERLMSQGILGCTFVGEGVDGALL